MHLTSGKIDGYLLSHFPKLTPYADGSGYYLVKFAQKPLQRLALNSPRHGWGTSNQKPLYGGLCVLVEKREVI